MARSGGAQAGRKRGERLPTETERRLWDQMTRDVTPMTTNRDVPPVDVPNIGSAPEPAADPPNPPAQPSPRKPGRVHEQRGGAPGKAAGPASLRVDDTTGMDRRTADRLKRGRLAIDARLDLHGMTRHDAQEALLGFLDRAAARDLRCVLVITGKGSRGGESGVLREEIARWLNLPQVRPKIVAVTQAQQRHGGAGAFYVLLRRRRRG